MLTPDFAFCHTVTISKYEGRVLNEDRYGAPVTVSGRVNIGKKRTYLRSGQAAREIVASGTAFFPAAAQVAPNDKLTFGGATYIVVESRPRFDFGGSINHVEVVFQ